MARVFRGKVAIPGDQMEAYLEALQRFSFGCDLITTVSEPTPNVVRAESRQGCREGGLKEGLRPSCTAPQEGFQLGPARLDRREVRRIGRQEDDVPADGSHRLFNIGDLMHCEIIEEDDIARL